MGIKPFRSFSEVYSYNIAKLANFPGIAIEYAGNIRQSIKLEIDSGLIDNVLSGFIIAWSDFVPIVDIQHYSGEIGKYCSNREYFF